MEPEDIARLEEKRKQALAYQDPSTYSSICDCLGIEPEDELLVEQAETEKVWNQMKKAKANKKKIFAKKFSDNLASQLNNTSYDRLEKIYFGLHNINLPNPINEPFVENNEPYALLAIYAGAEQLKRNDEHLKGLDEKPDFDYLVKYLFEEGNEILKLPKTSFAAKKSEKFMNTFSDISKNISQYDKDAFISYFMQDYLPPNEEGAFGPSFYNPNCDGNSVMVYKKGIYEILTSRCNVPDQKPFNFRKKS